MTMMLAPGEGRPRASRTGRPSRRRRRAPADAARRPRDPPQAAPARAPTAAAAEAAPTEAAPEQAPRRASSTALALPPGGLTDGVVRCARPRIATRTASRRSARTPRSRAGPTCRRRTRSRTRTAGSRWRAVERERGTGPAPGRRAQRDDERVVGAAALRLHGRPGAARRGGLLGRGRRAARRDRRARASSWSRRMAFERTVAALRRDRDRARTTRPSLAVARRAASRETAASCASSRANSRSSRSGARERRIARRAAAVVTAPPAGQNDGSAPDRPLNAASTLVAIVLRATRACSPASLPLPSARRA